MSLKRLNGMADFHPKEEEADVAESAPTESTPTESTPIPPASTFVVRFWPEWSLDGPRWRGRIEHVQSRQGVAFQDLEQMLDFMRSTGPVGDDRQSIQEQ